MTPGRSPADQPGWARPALLAVAAVEAVGYGWGMAGASVEAFYGAAARSMSESWHDFFFGAFDPAGTVTVDKLPGALWVQALSLRVFGFHIWALVLPQVVEGVLTVLLLYRAVRRLAGPAAGLTAAAVLAVTPVTVLLSRGNVSDSLLILLLVLAAGATSAALLTGSVRRHPAPASRPANPAPRHARERPGPHGPASGRLIDVTMGRPAFSADVHRRGGTGPQHMVKIREQR